MQIAGIIRNSVVNGIGIRDVIFLQGCNHHCVGCHNPDTWRLDGGKPMTLNELIKELQDSNNDITISGGEPLLQYDHLYAFMRRVNQEQHKRFWLYTGFRYEEIPHYMWKALSEYVDVVVDGRFEIEKRDLKLQFRGSSNQRLIDLPESVKRNEIVLWRDNE